MLLCLMIDIEVEILMLFLCVCVCQSVGLSRHVVQKIVVYLCGSDLQHLVLLLQYYDISAKSNYNFEKPFLCLARRLVGDPNLTFVEMPALIPPEVPMDPALARKYEDELRVG